MALRKRRIAKICIDGEACYRTTGYSERKYLGDPLNVARILSRLQADELHVISLSPPWDKHENTIKLISKYTTCPLGYGGYINTSQQVDMLMSFGIEKVILGKSLFLHPDLLQYSSHKYGSQSVVASIDVRFVRGTQSLSVWTNHGKTMFYHSIFKPFSDLPFAQIGELAINFIDYDGLVLPKELIDSLDNVNLPASLPILVSCGLFYDETINYALSKEWLSGVISSRKYASVPHSPSSVLTCFQQ